MPTIDAVVGTAEQTSSHKRDAVAALAHPTHILWTQLGSSFRGPSIARQPGIHTPQPGLSIPGSPPLRYGAPE